MLTWLSIRQLAIVDHLELDFYHGMTVITGETGAGKSILLSALALALGDRADSDSVRHGATKAEVSARFDLKHMPQARQWLNEQSLTNEDEPNECLLRRVVMANGRSRAYINGHACAVTQLKLLGQCLIDIHGQHAHQSLLRKETHLQLLDAFAGLESRVEHYQQQFRQWHQVRRQLKQLKENHDSQQAQLQLLRYQVEELDQLALKPDELADLEAEQHALANAEQMIRDSEQAQALCDHEEGAALQQVTRALQLLEGLSIESLDNIRNMLNDAQIQLQEASAELQHWTSSIELDPERLMQVEQRLSLIYQTARKHHVLPEELADHHQQLQAQLNDLTGSDTDLEALAEQQEALTQVLRLEADNLTKARRDASLTLAKQVNQQLTYLGMQSSSFEVNLKALEHFQSEGQDDIEFCIAPNPGQPAKPLIRIASGGELSRISLAIQVVTAQTTTVPTLVFDEVDVGISGATAEIVGRLLRQLSDRGQILCVTHLPQVAAQGHQHLHIHKHAQGNKTNTRMGFLDDAGRVSELARMLGGVNLSEQTLAHAREMLHQSQH